MNKIKRMVKSWIEENGRRNLIAYTECDIAMINNLEVENENFAKDGYCIIKLIIKKREFRS